MKCLSLILFDLIFVINTSISYTQIENFVYSIENTGFTKNINIDKKVFQYYNNINAAEKYLYENNSLKSLKLYIDTFEDYGILYFKDFILPFQISIRQKDTLSSTKLLSLLDYGQETTKTLFNFLNRIDIDTSSCWHKIANDYIDSSTLERSDSLKDYIDLMFVLDQQDRQNVYDKVFYLRRKKMREWDENSKIRIDSIINRIIENDMAEESLLGLDSNFFYHKKFYTILYHYPCSFMEYKGFIVDWINSGKMHPRHFAWVADFHERHRNKGRRLVKSIFSYGIFALQSPKLRIEDFSKMEIDEVNSKRLNICLPTIQHDLKLNNYINNNKLIYYFYLY